MAAGQSVVFTIVFDTLVNGTLVNTVNATSDETDNVTAENKTLVIRPNMTVEKLALNKTVIIGDKVYFMVIVHNTGDCDLADVKVSEIYKSGELVYAGHDKGTEWIRSGDVFTYSDVLAPGESANFTIWFTTLVNGTVINTVNASSNETENTTANNNTTVYKPNMSVEK